MMVFAGSDGRWKYEGGMLGFDNPIRLPLGARDLELVWKDRFVCVDSNGPDADDTETRVTESNIPER